MTIKYPFLQPNPNNVFVLLEDYEYKSIKIKAGYATNGADIPRAFWFIVPPFKPAFLPAVLVHDFLIENAKNPADIKIANEYFSIFISAFASTLGSVSSAANLSA